MNKETLDKLITIGTEEIINKEDLTKKIKSGKKLRIKHGVDPTSKDLHIGYAVVYHKLKEFQDMGHKIVFLIGDYTARFGDPTDKEKGRKMRDAKEVNELAKKYIEQVGKILDLKKTEIRYNSEWYDKMSAEDLLRLMNRFTIARLLERDMFDKRIKANKEIQLNEIVYPILQGWDSVMLKSDVTIIGTDQKFNELVGRKLQYEEGQKPQDIITVPLLVGTDGKEKMSQSLGNYIGITEDPQEKYGKVMSIPDNLILHYAELAARMSEKELKNLKKLIKENPRDAKALVAKKIVELYHPGKGGIVEAEFNRIFVDKQNPTEIEELLIRKKDNILLVDLLFQEKMVASKSEAKRLILQGGIKVDKAKIGDLFEKIALNNGMIIQVGKRKFYKVKTI